MMRLEQLYYFEKIYDEKSMAKAAEQLFVSQPAMSIAISNLEKELGVELFVRRKTGITVTEKGEEIIDCVRTALRNIEQIQEITQATAKQELRILSVPILSNTVLPTILSHWKKNNLSINVYMEDLMETSILDIFLSNAADHINYFTFCGMPQQEFEELLPQLQKAKITCIPLGSDEIYLYAGNGFFPGKTSVAWDDLKEVPQIFYDDGLESKMDSLELKKNATLKNTERNNPQNYIIVNNMTLLWQLLRDEVGVTLMPGLLFNKEELHDASHIRRIKVEGMNTTEYYLLYPQKQKLESYETDFIQEVQSYFHAWNEKRKDIV